MTTTSSNSTVLINKQNTDILLWVCRFFVGSLFIFSGLIKANDPMGFGYKLQEYFHVFHTDFFNDYSAYIAIAICALEIIFGVLLLLGIAGKKIAWGLLLLIIFFTFLTFYSAFFEVVTSCGCFGDAIPLTPWESFIKDLVLLVFILVIFVKRDKIKPLISNSFTNNLFTFLTVIASAGIGVYTVNFLPFIDFLPYRVGNNIPKLMEVPEGAALDEYQIIYTLKNKQTKEEKSVTDKEYMDQKIWEDQNWEIIGEPKSTLVKKGYQLPIPDLVITDVEGNDVTNEIITNPYYNFIVTSVDVNKMNAVDLLALDKLNKTIRDVSLNDNIRAILLTSSSPEDVKYISDQLDLVFETFYVDAVPLKSMVRSNPGVMLLQNGTVINKWSKFSFPNQETLTNLYFK